MPREASRSSATYEEVLRRIDAEGLQTNVALKLTHLGVAARRGARATRTSSGWSRERGAASGTSSASTWRTRRCVDVTLRIYRRLREAGHDNVGTVLQAYLYRTEDDLESLLPLQPNLRIVKGAYKEPPRGRVPEEGRRRRRVRAAGGALDRGGRVHGGRDARRGADRARDSRSTPAPSGWSCRCSTASGRSSSSTSSRAASASSRHAVRAGLVPVPDAPARRAPREPALLREERDPRTEAESVPGPHSPQRPVTRCGPKKFAEPGVAFVHRTDQPSACAYRLLGSASTYSRPVLGASRTLRTSGRGRARGAAARKLSQFAADLRMHG